MDLTFILTEDCNLRCTYCYQKNFAPTAMPAGVGLRAMRTALEHGVDSLALTFFGGEPLLQKQTLFALLAEARQLEQERRVPVTAKVPTNGLLLDEPFLEKAGELGLFISLSFDGVQPAQDAGRVSLDGLGSFQHAHRALRLLLAWGKPFGVYSVVTPANVRHLAESRRWLWDQGVRILISAIDYTADWNDEALATLVEQYAELGEAYERMLAHQGYFYLEPFDSRIALRTRAREVQNCCPGIRSVTVAPDGTLYGCVEYFYRRRMALGDVDGWLDPEKVKALARTRTNHAPECLECGVRDRCTQSCDCVNMRVSQQANRPPESVCLTEQATLRMVDSVAARLFKKRVPNFLVRHYSDSYSLLSAVEAMIQDMEARHEQLAPG